jgi:hypothetical protein
MLTSVSWNSLCLMDLLPLPKGRTVPGWVPANEAVPCYPAIRRLHSTDTGFAP